VIVHAVVDDSLSDSSPLGDAVETFIRREDGERFIEGVRRDDPDLASHLRIEERELEAGGLAAEVFSAARCRAETRSMPRGTRRSSRG
jgi:hypothetical protein